MQQNHEDAILTALHRLVTESAVPGSTHLIIEVKYSPYEMASYQMASGHGTREYGARALVKLTWLQHDDGSGDFTTLNTSYMNVMDQRQYSTAQGASPRSRSLALAIDVMLRGMEVLESVGVDPHPAYRIEGAGVASIGGTTRLLEAESIMSIESSTDGVWPTVALPAEVLPAEEATSAVEEPSKLAGAPEGAPSASGTSTSPSGAEEPTSSPVRATTVPAKVPDTIVGHDRLKEIIALGVRRGASVLLEGPTGCGKTGIVEELAYRDGREFVRVNLNGGTSVDEFVGRWHIKDGSTYWRDGVLLKAMRSGAYLLCDELNSALPEILFVLQPLLDDARYVRVVEKDADEVVYPHPSFRFFAAINPSAEYAGTKELNPALKSRFGVYARMSYPAPFVETQILIDRVGTPRDVAAMMTDLAVRFRKDKEESLVYGNIGTRDLIHWAELFRDLSNASGRTPRAMLTNVAEAAEYTVLARNEEDRTLIIKHLTDLKKDLGDILAGAKRSPFTVLDEATVKLREATEAESRAKRAEQAAREATAEAARKMAEVKRAESEMRETVARKVTEIIMGDLSLAVGTEAVQLTIDTVEIPEQTT